MSSTDPRDPRTGTAVDPDEVIVVHDRPVVTPGHTVVVPDAAPPPPVQRRRRFRVGDNTALWVMGFLVVIIVIAAIFVWVLAPDGGEEPSATPPVTAVEPVTGVASGLALPAPDTMRTHTVNVAGDQDLLALATSPGALAAYAGAPVTADGVVVTQLLGDRAFEVSNGTGGTMVVYLPYVISNQVVVTLAQQLTFVGSVSPTPDDLTAFAGSSATAAATPDGAYIIALPESIHVPGPSLADQAAA